jgi:hypothetical protein
VNRPRWLDDAGETYRIRPTTTDSFTHGGEPRLLLPLATGLISDDGVA